MTAQNNVLVVLFEGAPVFFGYTIPEVREFLADVLEEHGDLYQVYEVFNDTSTANDMTVRFARDWSRDLEFGDGDDPDDFLKPFHGYVLAHVRDELVAAYRAAQTDAESDAFERSKVRSL